ncbi:MAG: ABC transporter ATP-binding protein [Pseudomonadota bacterium]
MDILAVEDLTVEFDGSEGLVRAVDRVSFRVPQSRTVAVVGESGSGKTVISQAVMGLLPDSARIANGRILFSDPSSGNQIDIAALDRDGQKMRALRGNRIAIIFQEPMTSLSPLHTIGDQIGEAARLHSNLSRSAARAVTREMLGLVHFPDPERALTTYPFELSGGLRQRAMIAMAMVCRPALLIADEPTTALDVTIQAEILKLMRDVQQELDMSMLLITHDFGVVANMADDVVVVYHGQIMEAGASKELFADPQHDYLKALLNAVPRFDMDDDERLVPIRPIEVKADQFAEPGAKQPKPGETVVDVRDVTKKFVLRKGGFLSGKPRTVRALDAISFTVKCGECLGLVGESGSGKTTVSRAVLRGLAIDEGQIQVDTGRGLQDVSSLAGDELMAYRRRVQMIFQDPFSSLNPRMTVNDILLEPFLIHGLGSEEERAERVRDLIQLVGLDVRFLRRYPHSFSGGQRQRIGIARALALQPEIILCDEPVSALDVSVQAQILNLLKDLKANLGLTYIFVSHNLAVVDYIADRIAVMCKGRLVEIGEKTAIVQRPIHPYTQALLAAVPEPSLDNLLDFEKLSAGRASQPETWPEPFRLDDDIRPKMVEMRPGHFVCAPGAASKMEFLEVGE